MFIGLTLIGISMGGGQAVCIPEMIDAVKSDLTGQLPLEDRETQRERD
jgi:hypothetical protein